MEDAKECPYCKQIKITVQDRTHSLYSAPGKVIYIYACEDCFNKMDLYLKDRWHEYYREICSDI